MTSLSERIAHLHTMGLDARYDDVIGFGDLSGTAVGEADRAAFLAAGPAYDYQAQRWMDHPDHAHMAQVGDLPLLFCGSDITTCVGLPAEVIR